MRGPYWGQLWRVECEISASTTATTTHRPRENRERSVDPVRSARPCQRISVLRRQRADRSPPPAPLFPAETRAMFTIATERLADAGEIESLLDVAFGAGRLAKAS